MKNTSLIGDISVAAITLTLLRNGYKVSKPINEGLSYDLVIEIQNSFYGVQCKTGILKKSKNWIEFRTFTVKRSGENHKYKNDVTYFAVYCPQLDEVYLIPNEICTTNLVKLSLGDVIEKECDGLKLASKFKI